MKPNLDRISGDGDWRAGEILQQTPAIVTRPYLDSLREGAALALGRYGYRHTTIALREGSADHLRGALMAVALSDLLEPDDSRDVMIGLALHFHVAQELGLVPSEVFAAVADRLPAGPTADLLRQFGARDDITLRAFLWRLVDTPDGPDFEPIPWG